MNLLCKIGIHKYSKPRIVTSFSSNVEDITKKCKRCGKVKKSVRTKGF